MVSFAFPFLRYRIGDYIELEEDVPDKLPYMCIKRIIGRKVDTIVLRNGKKIHGVAFAHAIDPFLNYIRRYLVIQRRIDKIEIQLELQKRKELINIEKLKQEMESLVLIRGFTTDHG